MNKNRQKRFRILGIILMLSFIANTAFSVYGATYDSEVAQEEQALLEKQKLEENKKLKPVGYRLTLELQDKTLYNEGTSISTENGFYNSYDINVVKTNISGNKYIIKHPYSENNFIEITLNDGGTVSIYELDSNFDRVRPIGTFTSGSVYIKDSVLESLYKTEDSAENTKEKEQ